MLLANSKPVFIINPIAGTRQKQSIHEVINKTFAAGDCEVLYTQYPGNAYEIASQKVGEGYRKIIAVGGDGTVNEVASALVNTDCRLGIVPAGSGNGLARHLSIPLSYNDALKVILDPVVKTIDAGQANGRYFFCTCGIGFDATVGKKFAEENKRGMITYVKAAVNQYIHYSPKKYILKTDDKNFEIKAFLLTFANSGQYGNNAYIAPNAVIDDGWLDLCILKPFPKTFTLELGLRLFFKNIDRSPYLEVMRVKKATLKRKKKNKIVIHLDGDPLTLKSKLKVKILPGALHVMTPHRL